MRFASGRYTGIHRHLKGHTSGSLLAAFGLRPGHHIPPDHAARRIIDGICVEIRPKTKRGMEKRVFAECPTCGLWFEAGHLHQHTEARHP